MCYKRPGPRCSTHAKAAFVRAHMKTIEAVRGRTDPEEYVRLREAEKEAEWNFYMTPWGQADLQRRIDRGEDTSGYLAETKVRAWQARLEALQALKAQDQGDTNEQHDLPELHHSGEELMSDPTCVRTAWAHREDRAALVEAYLDESLHLTARLTPEERDAVRFWTSNGCKIVGDHLYGKKSEEEHEGQIRQAIANLDSVFSKVPQSSPRVVYRGLNDWTFPEEIIDNKYRNRELFSQQIDQHLEENYPVGKTITFPSYQSATADPASARSFSGPDVILEVKTRRAAAVGIMSAWEASEREMLLPRDMKVRVVGIQRGVRYQADRDPNSNKEFIIIQVEDAD